MKWELLRTLFAFCFANILPWYTFNFNKTMYFKKRNGHFFCSIIFVQNKWSQKNTDLKTLFIVVESTTKGKSYKLMLHFLSHVLYNLILYHIICRAEPVCFLIFKKQIITVHEKLYVPLYSDWPLKALRSSVLDLCCR